MIDLMLGDCLERMKEIPDNSIDSIVTDPPYGLAFMGKKWDYDVPSTELWIEAFRVLKPGGHLLSFGGTRTYHRLVVNIENAGFEVRDMIQWIYGSGFPKSMAIGKQIDKQNEFVGEVIGSAKGAGKNDEGYKSGSGGLLKSEYEIRELSESAKQWEGWGTALKPANEPICVARKPLSESTVAKNVLRWGTGGLNIDGCRIEYQSEADKASARPQGNMAGVQIYKGQSQSESKTINTGFKQNAQGRWPANVIFDEEAAAALDEQSGLIKTKLPFKKVSEHTFGVGNDKIHKGQKFESQKGLGITLPGASRFFYIAKASKRERNAGLNDGQISTHPTVKPIKLMEYLIKLITSEKGCVFDPFMGSGSTGVAAKNLKRKFIGIEKDPEYFEIAKKRILGGNDNDQDQAD